MAKNFKKKAFTLVEILTVIVVIGILAAMIMFASDEIVSTAQAARIVANLTNWKQASLAWYHDHVSIVLYNGMLDKSAGSSLGLRDNTTSRPSGFREDTSGLSSYGVVTAKNILPYLSMSGLTLTRDGRVVDGYGGQYLTDYATTNELGTASSNDHYVKGNRDEYIWMIDYQLPNMSTRLKEKLQRRIDASQREDAANGGIGQIGWKYPGQSFQYAPGASKEKNSIGILVLDFTLFNDSRY